MTTNGFIIGDGSWNLQIYVSDLQVERTLRVKGDLHVGGVMLRLVEDLGESRCVQYNIIISLCLGFFIILCA